MVRTADFGGSPPPGSVIVGVDGSEGSRQALRWGARHARLTGHPLVAFTAWEQPMSFGWAGLPADAAYEEKAKAILVESVDGALGSDADATLIAARGHPALALVDASLGAALVVVGCRGRGEFAGMLLGSVSQFLATHSHCPVAIVRDTD